MANQKFVCQKCKKSFVTTSSLNRHISFAHEKTALKCTGCDKQFRSNFELRRHIDSVHEKKKKHLCIICVKSFSTLQRFQSHEKTTKHKKNVENKRPKPVLIKFVTKKKQN